MGELANFCSGLKTVVVLDCVRGALSARLPLGAGQGACCLSVPRPAVWPLCGVCAAHAGHWEPAGCAHVVEVLVCPALFYILLGGLTARFQLA